MSKILAVVPDRCTDCQMCILHCSFFHDKTHSPSRARIYVVSHEPDVITPVICTQCGLCMNACPIPNAMKRDTKTGAVIVTDKCNGCGQCIMACPYGVIFVDSKTNKAIKCDLCDGNPSCVRHCPYDALIFADPEKAMMYRRVATALAIGRRDIQIAKQTLQFPLPIGRVRPPSQYRPPFESEES